MEIQYQGNNILTLYLFKAFLMYFNYYKCYYCLLKYNIIHTIHFELYIRFLKKVFRYLFEILMFKRGIVLGKTSSVQMSYLF